jgi:hypothetical protein
MTEEIDAMIAQLSAQNIINLFLLANIDGVLLNEEKIPDQKID